MTPVRLEPATLRSRVKHSTTEPLCSLYCSIYSAIKCPLEITADDYFETSNGAVYDAIQAAYIVLRIMG